MVADYQPAVIDGKPVINYGAVAFRFEDVDLQQAYNAELEKLEESGELLKILSQFEGFGEYSLPGDATFTSVCPEQYAEFGD